MHAHLLASLSLLVLSPMPYALTTKVLQTQQPNPNNLSGPCSPASCKYKADQCTTRLSHAVRDTRHSTLHPLADRCCCSSNLMMQGEITNKIHSPNYKSLVQLSLLTAALPGVFSQICCHASISTGFTPSTQYTEELY